ncbi:MAG: hypothetical protein R2867_33670 [Caldilineaceae bacterium]
MTEFQQTVDNIDTDLTILEAFANELEDYIVEGRVYRTVIITAGHGNRRLEMSGGDVLARIKTLQTIRMNLAPDMKDRLNSVITQVETTKQELKGRFHEILRRELKSRLDTLRWSNDTKRANDDKESTPAAQQNLLRIEAIREELENDVPKETVDELDALTAELEEAVEQLKQGQPSKTS